MSPTERLQSPSRSRAPSWTVLVLALLATAVLVFLVVFFVDGLRHATGFRLERPLRLFIGVLVISVGAVGSGVAARSAWRWPGRARPMVVVAALGLAATCLGGLLVVRSYVFHVMPRLSEIVPEHEGSAGTEDGFVGVAAAGAGTPVAAPPSVRPSE